MNRERAYNDGMNEGGDCFLVLDPNENVVGKIEGEDAVDLKAYFRETSGIAYAPRGIVNEKAMTAGTGPTGNLPAKRRGGRPKGAAKTTTT